MRSPIDRREDSLGADSEADRGDQGDPAQKRAAQRWFPLGMRLSEARFELFAARPGHGLGPRSQTPGSRERDAEHRGTADPRQ